jgi:hypothetical protein
MCLTGVIISLNQSNKEKSKRIIEDTLEEQAFYNPDGFSLVSSSLKMNRINQAKTLDRKTALEAISQDNSPLLFYHFRLATSGQKNAEGLHFWRRNNFLFAHNGSSHNLPVGSPLVDSQYFFYQLISRINDKERNKPFQVAKVLKEEFGGQIGRFQLLDLKNGRAYFVGDWKAYLINNDYLLISSGSLSFSQERKVKGLSFSKGINNILKATFRGVYSLEKGNFFKLANINDYSGSSYFGSSRLGFSSPKYNYY